MHVLKTCVIVLCLALFSFSFTPYVAAHDGEVRPEEATTSSETEKPVDSSMYETSSSSTLTVDSATKQLWIYLAVAAAGIVAGSIGTFILLTVTLHPKK